MKTRTLVLISILILICILLIGGCATTAQPTKPTSTTRTARIPEPKSPSSTLLIGRIKLTCTEFPNNYHVNGEHTNGVTVYLWNYATEEVISIRSHGADGVFYLIDPEPANGRYVLFGFGMETGTSTLTLNLRYTIEDKPYDFVLTENAVNNLGDIRWNERYETQSSKEYTDKGSQSTFASVGSHVYELNYDEVESWSKRTYPDSDWSMKNWVNAR